MLLKKSFSANCSVSSPSPAPKRWTSEAGGPLVIRLSGDLDASQISHLKSRLVGFARCRHRLLLFHLGSVSFFDSAVIAVLVDYYRNARSFSGCLALVDPPARLQALIDLYRLREILPVYNGPYSMP